MIQQRKSAGNDMEKTSKIELAKMGIVVFGCCVTIATTVFLMGRQTGQVEQKINLVCESMSALNVKVESHDNIIEEMRRETAYQKGVVNTKLNSLEGSVKTIEVNVQKLLENLQLVEDK